MSVSSRGLSVRTMLFAAAMLLPAAAVWAIVDPSFTPIVLVDNAEAVLEVSAGAPKKPGTLSFTVTRELKGKAAAKEIEVDLAQLDKTDAEGIAAKLAAPGKSKAILFTGNYGEPGARDQVGEGNAKVFLHTGGRWIELEEKGAGTYQALADDPNLQPTWAGGTDMLIRGVEYKMAAKQPNFPVGSGVAWTGRQDVAVAEGRVTAARAVDLDGKPAMVLHVASDGGDRLYAFDPGAKGLRDVTGERKLSAKSAASTWGDFNGDGRPDLASWDGGKLLLRLQGQDGSFGAAPADAGLVLDGPCLGLSVIDCGGKPGLLASTAGWPVLVAPAAGGGYASKPAGEGALPGADGLGAASACLVADFDGDAVADALQLFEKGGLFYKGQGGGAFAAPVAAAIEHGPGQSPPAMGDFDADGQMDVVVAARDKFRIWQNRGGLKFDETLKTSGEVEYKTGGNGIGAAVGDFTGDGRQDLLAMFSDQGPAIFYNRGFRSFADAVGMAPTAQDLEDGMDIFQQAGCFGDFNGDGALDMAMVFKKGHVCFFPGGRSEDAFGETPLSVSVSLAPDAGCAGSVLVSGSTEDRALGAQVISSGSPPALFALREAGTVKLRWQLPGREAEEKVVELEDQPLTLRIGAPGK